MPFLTGLLVRLGVVDKPSPRKIHRSPVPRGGGLSIALGVIVSGVTVTPRRETWPLLLAASCISMAGFLDDRSELRAGPKFLVTSIPAVIWVIARFGWQPRNAYDLIFQPFYLFASMHAFNLIDGLDGLAASLAIVVALTNVLASFSHVNAQVAVLSAALAGACVGFLPYNLSSKRKVFMGDAGSLMLGFLVAATAMSMPSERWQVSAAYELCVVAVPMLDLAFVVLRRLWEHRPLFSADTKHLYNLLANLGLAPSVVVVLYAGAALGLGIVGITLLL